MVQLNDTGTFLKYAKYCLVGGIGAITDFSLFTLLVRYLQMNYLISNIISITIALVIVYILQKSWTFRYVTEEKVKTFQRYLLSVLVTYVLNNGILLLLVEKFGFDVIISKMVQIAISTVWGFYLTNFLVFNKRWEK